MSAFPIDTSTARNAGPPLAWVGSVVILVVVHTYGDVNGEEIIGIISARKATKGERSRYEDES